jgi:hypothetical protein
MRGCNQWRQRALHSVRANRCTSRAHSQRRGRPCRLHRSEGRVLRGARKARYTAARLPLPRNEKRSCRSPSGQPSENSSGCAYTRSAGKARLRLLALGRRGTVHRECPLWVRKLPQHYAGENVRFDISIAQSSRSGVGQLRSRLICAQPGHAGTLVGFPKADKASRRRVGWDGWIPDIQRSRCDGKDAQ